MTLNRRTLLKSAGLSLTALGGMSANVSAQGQDKSLNLLVPWPAGGPADTVARSLLPELSRVAGVPAIIENVAGAGGLIGLSRYAERQQAQRGLVLVSNSDVINALLATSGQKIKPEDFQLVGVTARGGQVLLVRGSLAVQSFDDLVKFARAQPAQSLKIGHYGQGGVHHVINEELMARTGITALQVPYKGATDGLKDLAIGEIDLLMAPLTAAVIAFPRVRPIATTAAVRNPYFPNLPTVAESTLAAGYQAEGWYALAVLRDTVAADADRLQRWTQLALASDAVASSYKSRSAVVPPVLTRNELDQLFRTDIERSRQQLKRLGLLAQPA